MERALSIFQITAVSRIGAFEVPGCPDWREIALEERLKSTSGFGRSRRLSPSLGMSLGDECHENLHRGHVQRSPRHFGVTKTFFPRPRLAGRGPCCSKQRAGAVRDTGSQPNSSRESHRVSVLSPGESLVLDASLGLTASTGAEEQEPSELAEVERRHLLRTLERCGWRIKGRGNAAERLGLSPSTLRDRMRKLGIQRP